MKTYELYQINEGLNEKIYSRIISSVKSENEIEDAYKALSETEKFALLSLAADTVGEDYDGDLEDLVITNIVDLYRMKE